MAESISQTTYEANGPRMHCPKSRLTLWRARKNFGQKGMTGEGQTGQTPLGQSLAIGEAVASWAPFRASAMLQV